LNERERKLKEKVKFLSLKNKATYH